MRARIVAVRPTWMDVGDRDDPNRKIMGTYNVELTVVAFDGTYEDAVAAHENGTEFDLIPVDEEPVR